MKKTIDTETNAIAGISRHQNQPKALTLDWQLYAGYLENSELSDAEKQEFISTLWSIMVSFVDLGFELHPLQQVGDKNSAELRKLIHQPKNMLGSSTRLSQKTFANAVHRPKNDHTR